MAAKKKKTKKAPVKKAKTVKRPAKKAATRKPAEKAAPKRKATAVKKAPKAVAAKKTPAKKNVTKAAPKTATAKKEYGEGNYKASKRFRESQEGFVQAHKSEIPAMAKQAEAALDGPEGKDLRAAEQKAKAHGHGDPAEE